MARWRPRHLRRDVLVFLGSLVAHVGVFMLAASEFTYYPQPPEFPEPPLQLQIVPRQELEVPPIPFVKLPKTAPAPQQPLAPAPNTKVQPQPPTPTPAQALVAPSAPTIAQHRAAPAPGPRAAVAPTELAPALSAEVEGPHRAVPRSAVRSVQPSTVSTPHIVLHRTKEEAGAPFAPAISIPGAVMAPAPQANGAPAGAVPGAGAPGGGLAGHGLPAGLLPGFGPGFRGSREGCYLAETGAVQLTSAEQARCAEIFGEGAKESPRMDPIAARRAELDHEAAVESAAEKYRDSMPSGTVERTVPGQPGLSQLLGH